MVLRAKALQNRLCVRFDVTPGSGEHPERMIRDESDAPYQIVRMRDSPGWIAAAGGVIIRVQGLPSGTYVPDLLTAIVGGLVGAGIAVIGSYKVQSKLAANRREEQEQRIAYIRFVQISEVVAAEDLVGKYLKALLDAKRDGGHDLKEDIPKDAGYSQKHAITAMLANLIKEAARKETNVDLSFLASATLARSFTRMLEFSMALSELADLPKDTVYAYSSFAHFASSFRISIEFILESFSKWKLAPLTADFLMDTYETMHLTLEKAKELRAALIIRSGVTKQDAAKLYSQQYQNFYRLLVLNQSNRASNEAARKALEIAAKEPDASP